MNFVVVLLAGAVFGGGLVISGMSDQNKILNFLDVSGQWDPSLLFVMIGALAVSIPSFHLILKCQTPLMSKVFILPRNGKVNRPLVLGPILFGIGWGIYGYCPGPVIISLVYFCVETYIFLITMLLGVYMTRKLKRD